MEREVLVATEGGLYRLGDRSGPELEGRGPELEGREVTAVADSDGALWAVLDGRSIALRGAAGWDEVPGPDGLDARCILPVEDRALVGTSQAGLFSVEGGALSRVDGFDGVEGRSKWYTPWGGPPDTRSMSRGADGTLFVNVHVGGIPRSRDGGRTWEPTIDVDADVHQVLAHPERPEVVLAATAWGLAISDDGGDTWRFETEGLQGSYCRAVAVAGDQVLVSASTGPFTRQAAVYRRGLAAGGAFERCRDGLPDWFDANIDSHCLAARGDTVAAGTASGEVFWSTDGGKSWRTLAADLPPVRGLALVPRG